MAKLVSKLLSGLLVLLLLILIMQSFNSITSQNQFTEAQNDSLIANDQTPEDSTLNDTLDASDVTQDTAATLIEVEVVPLEALITMGYHFEGTLLKKGVSGTNQEAVQEELLANRDQQSSSGGQNHVALHSQHSAETGNASTAPGDGGLDDVTIWAAITEGLIPPLELENLNMLPAREVINCYSLVPVAVEKRQDKPAIRFAIVNLEALESGLRTGRLYSMDPRLVLQRISSTEAYGTAGIGGKELLGQFFHEYGFSFHQLVAYIEQQTEVSNVDIGFMYPIETEILLKRFQYQTLKAWDAGIPWSELSLMKGIWIRRNGEIQVEISQVKHRIRGWITL